MYVHELKSDRSMLQLSYHVGNWLIWLLLDCQVDDVLYLLAKLCKCKSTLGQQMCRASGREGNSKNKRTYYKERLVSHGLTVLVNVLLQSMCSRCQDLDSFNEICTRYGLVCIQQKLE